MPSLDELPRVQTQDTDLTAPFRRGLAELTGINDMAKLFRGGLTGDEQKDIAIQAAMALIPGARIAKAVRPGIRAFHGSPHDFDRFDMSRIGTGEGAQAYGRGLYFAENEGTARSYEQSLSRGKGWRYEGKAIDYDTPYRVRNALDWLKDTERPGEAVADTVARRIDDLTKHGRYMRESSNPADRSAAGIYDNAVSALKELDTSKLKPPSGRMYEVNIAAKPEQFLDWDKPLAGQSAFEKMPALADAAKEEAYQRALASTTKARQDQLYAMVKNPDQATGQMAYQEYVRQQNIPHGAREAAVSQQMRDAGIPGIRYLDQGSRGAGQGTSNYVVFDDSLIDILRKYGLAGLPAGAAATGALGGLPRAEQ